MDANKIENHLIFINSAVTVFLNIYNSSKIVDFRQSNLVNTAELIKDMIREIEFENSSDKFCQFWQAHTQDLRDMQD